jgi:hypothetical protein
MGKMATVVMRMALLVGFLSFAAGVVLPVFLSTSMSRRCSGSW